MEATPAADTPWGVDSEYGRLLDVLLCPPDHFRWLPTSAISRATLDSGLVFSHDDAVRQHAEMVSVYEQVGVTVHFLEPDPAFPYDSEASAFTLGGGGGAHCLMQAIRRERVG
jgi:arginine deiminase